MQLIISPHYQDKREKIANLLVQFGKNGTVVVKGARNTIKSNYLEDDLVSIKYFKKPSTFQKIIYSYFRKTKAKRSFEYAHYLLKKNIATPTPIAYAEERSMLNLLGKSYYVCDEIAYDFTMRELIHDPLFFERELIIEQFTEFTYMLHQANVNFLDHSPGNTLIVNKGNSNYDFYLIDLNRMKFENLPIELRMDNFKKMWLSKKMMQTVAKKYAQLSGESEVRLLDMLYKTAGVFKRKINEKKWLKRKIKALKVKK